MNKFFLFLMSWLGFFGITAQAQTAATDYAALVNPLMGTASSYELSAGNTYPAICRPWGMNFWTPQTGKNGNGWQYTYTAHRLRGFKQTHQPSPWINDYGQFSLMPLVGRGVFDEEGRASWFSHLSEKATPYSYEVYLADHDVRAELVPTERACLMRFTFPQTDSAWVAIDAFDGGSAVAIDTLHRRISGYTTKNSGGVADGFCCWFVVEFDTPFSVVRTVLDGQQADTLEARGNHAGAMIGFRTTKGQRVTARLASSFIGIMQARQNLRAELADKSLETLREEGRKAWNDVLGRIEVDMDDIDQARTFYSCLYRCLLFPRKLYECDADGNILHRSPYDGKLHTGYLYTDTGFWDTFRSLFPLLNLVYPDVNREMQEGFLNAYRESGFFPEWCSPGHRDCMVGNNSASVLTDAYLKGVRVADSTTLFEGLLHATRAVHPTVGSTGRKGYDWYNKLGYIPCDVGINESAARTLEYAYNDWCLWQLAKEMGRADTAELHRRALNYRNLFDPSHRLMRGKRKDGTWQTPFEPLKWGEVFTEGNAWHYTWSVFHDIDGLIRLMGGKENFCQMLDSVFSIPPRFDASYYGGVIHEIREMQVAGMGNYAHGNQPIQHMIYLYDWAGQPWKTQQHVHDAMRKLYRATPDGYPGDEDNGQTSAWYVFSALGFYPVCPGTDQYAIGSPLFRRAAIHFANGRTTTLTAPDVSADNVYIHRLTMDGKPYTRNYLRHETLQRGICLHFDMAPQPDTQRGTTPTDAPYSMSRDE